MYVNLIVLFHPLLHGHFLLRANLFMFYLVFFVEVFSLINQQARVVHRVRIVSHFCSQVLEARSNGFSSHLRISLWLNWVGDCWVTNSVCGTICHKGVHIFVYLLKFTFGKIVGL